MISNAISRLFSVPLLITGLVLTLGGLNAEAATLKDIRIGEYKGFTRIVYEFDTTGSPPHIQPQVNGILSVSFDDTRPSLIRKIPVDRSDRISGLKLTHRDGQLSTVLQFDFDHFRFETFPLENPPRIAVDIYPLTAKPTLPEERTETMDTPAKTQAAPDAGSRESNTRVEAEPPSQVVKKKDILRSTQATAEPKEPPADEAEVRNGPSANPPPAAEPPMKLPTYVTEEDVPPEGPPESSRLQFYLVIVLVVITIVILALLLLMLLARQKWAGDKDVPNVNEYLKNQDQRIASINARIQEQLKRYEEA